MAPKQHAPSSSSLEQHLSVRTLVPAFLALCLVRCFSAMVQPIADCDEVFNYWEPTHLILYKERSFQTWEYSPEFSLRSYLYVLMHVAFGKLFMLFFSSKVFENNVFIYFRLLFFTVSVRVWVYCVPLVK